MIVRPLILFASLPILVFSLGCERISRPLDVAATEVTSESMGAEPLEDEAPVRPRPTSLSEIVVVDLWAKRRLMTDYAVESTQSEHRAMVLVFFGTECPVARVYVPTLLEMERNFRDEGVQFVGVFSNAGEDLLDIAVFAQDYEIAFPVVKDPDAQLADFLQVDRTPEVVVLDAAGELIYRGLVNDQYRAGGRMAAASKHYLADVLQQHLAGETIQVAKTLATGCYLDRRGPATPKTVPITYSEHVASIIQTKCEFCHRSGQIGPFPLQTYAQVRRHAAMIDEVVTDRRMPPLAGMSDPQFGNFSNHPDLTEQEIETLTAWCRGGADEGDPSLAPPPIQWESENLIAEPDLVLEMPEAISVPADGTLAYRYVQIPTTFNEDKWVTACEVVPSNASVVHHVLAHISGRRKQLLFGLGAMYKLNGANGEKSRLLGQYTVGDGLVQYPDTMAMRLPARTYVALELHYMPNGIETQDKTKVLLTFADEPPEHAVRSVVFNKRGFKIPAFDPYVKMENSWHFEKPALIQSIRPHMHRRGKHWEFKLRYPDGQVATLLKVPRWYYDWQLGAIFETPVPVPAGSDLLITAVYDNSIHNPNNPDPSVDVTWGLQDTDEMMAGGMRIVELDHQTP